MIKSLLKRIFGSRNDRVLKRMQLQVEAINAIKSSMAQLTDAQLRAKTHEFRQRLQTGTTVDQLLVEAFAVVREVSSRTIGLCHYDVQLIGGIALHHGQIAEMRTGEGKTLMATLPAYLNALTGKGVHIVTVNDYLAKRDSTWMRPVYEFLGLTVAVILPDMSKEEKRQAYLADIVCGTNNEFGFDYLRDNMAFVLDDKVQRPLHFAVIDEVDSILIDEARTPLIISGPAEGSSELYAAVNRLVPQLSHTLKDVENEQEPDADFMVDEKQRQCHFTEQGLTHVEQLLHDDGLIKDGTSLYDASNITLMHHLNAAMRAHTLYHRNIDYIVKDNQIVIVDEHTGRTMPGRRWSDGLHQAVEAKEAVEIQNENQTLASITFQNYFRLYDKLSGMTGTADTEAYEFQQIYQLEVVVIPTNKPMIRADEPDLVFLTPADKYEAIVEDIIDCQSRQQPVLIGTASIETSDLLSNMLRERQVSHEVLNAKYHEKEAYIIAKAGEPGAVTIATNMAGRGTDIVLGGNLEVELFQLGEINEEDKSRIEKRWQKRHQQVIESGGLRVIGSERHESRRIDNQLRGRSGRQGDPGSSRFYLSLEDSLMRIFASEAVASMMRRLGMQPGEAIEHRLVTRAIENAQRKVEGRNFDIRKQLLEYDNVANEQRQVIYAQRNELLNASDVHDMIERISYDVVQLVLHQYVPPETLEEEWQIQSLETRLNQDFSLTLPIHDWLVQDKELGSEGLRQKIQSAVKQALTDKEQRVGSEAMRQLEKNVVLRSLDTHWREHLAMMDQLRQGIHLRGYAQKDPKQEYKREAFELFNMLIEQLKVDAIQMLCTVQVDLAHSVDDVIANQQPGRLDLQHTSPQSTLDDAGETTPKQTAQVIDLKQHQGSKVGRNALCPCGSGKKYKHCHGRLG